MRWCVVNHIYKLTWFVSKNCDTLYIYNLYCRYFKAKKNKNMQESKPLQSFLTPSNTIINSDQILSPPHRSPTKTRSHCRCCRRLKPSSTDVSSSSASSSLSSAPCFSPLSLPHPSESMSRVTRTSRHRPPPPSFSFLLRLPSIHHHKPCNTATPSPPLTRLHRRHI